jgi:aspartyl protease family protein
MVVMRWFGSDGRSGDQSGDQSGAGAASWSAVLLSLSAACPVAQAVDVGLAGVFPGKALLTIDGGAPRTVAAGARTDEGVRVLSVDRDTATIETDGKKRILRVGQNVASPPAGDGGARATLTG